MAGAAAAAQAGLARHGSSQQLVAVQAALHQRAGLAAAAQRRRLGRRRAWIVGCGVDGRARQIQPGCLGRCPDARLGADQQRRDQARLRGLHGGLQRARITGIGHGHRNGALRLGLVEQVLEMGAVRGGRIIGGHGK